MRVVKYGHIKPMYAFCPGCGAILEFDKSDQRLSIVALHKGLQNDGKDWLIKCPVCTRTIYDGNFKDTAEEC
jgi:predicted  nucleic acid-binding Zn-ribbon protein